MSYVEYFTSAPRSRQAILAAGFFVVVVALGLAIYFTFLRVPYAPLFANMRTSDAATIVAELDKKKVPYRLKDGGSTILVPANIVDSTRLNVMSEDLPIKGAIGFELFNKSDMGLTEFAQKINYQRALQGELARTIMTLDSVDSARVHLSLPDPTIFRDDKRTPKASATIIARPGKQISASTVAGIRRLIAAAVPDLATGNVVILDQAGNLLGGDEVGDDVAATSPDMQQEHAIEEYYTARVREALQPTYPNPNVAISIPAFITANPATESDRAVLSEWSPGARRFRLSVAIGTGKSLTPAEQESVRQLAQGALGRGPGNADEVIVSPDGAPAAIEANASQSEAATALTQGGQFDPPPAAPAAKASTIGSASTFWFGLFAVVLLPLIFLAGLLARGRSRRERPLTDEERLEFADQFRAALAKEGGGASSRF